jgi:hypothetical protein
MAEGQTMKRLKDKRTAGVYAMEELSYETNK